MNKRPEVTDEEIRSFMDFGAIMKKHREITTSRMQWGKAIKLSSVFFGVALMTVILYNSISIPDLDSVLSNQPESEMPTQADSIATDQFTAQPQEHELQETPSVIHPVEDRNKVSDQIEDEEDEQSIESTMSAPSYVEAEPVAGFHNLYEYFKRELMYPAEALQDSTQRDNSHIYYQQEWQT